MIRHKVTLIPGEGIGPEVAAATRHILEATGVQIDWEEIAGRSDSSSDQEKRRFRLFSGRRSQIETPAVEVNRVNEILFVPESPSCVFDPLDLRVERFARSIGDAMP